jgi:hypothetical protein
MPGRILMSRKKFNKMHERGGTFDACAEPPRERGFCRYAMKRCRDEHHSRAWRFARPPASSIPLRLLPLCQFCSVPLGVRCRALHFPSVLTRAVGDFLAEKV